MTTVELLRHGKAHSRKRWSGRSDRERPLNEEGWHQAKLLALEMAQGDGVASIVSSPLVRCTQSVEPLAGALGLELVTDERVAELRTLPLTENGSAWVASAWLGGRAVGLLDELVARHPDERVVVCSHGDVVPAVLALLAGRDGLDLPDVRVKKGGRVTLTFEGRRCVDAARVEPVAKQAVV